MAALELRPTQGCAEQGVKFNAVRAHGTVPA